MSENENTNKFDILDEWVKSEASLGKKDDTEISIDDMLDEIIKSEGDIESLKNYFNERVNKFSRHKYYTSPEQKARYHKIELIIEKKRLEFENNKSNEADKPIIFSNKHEAKADTELHDQTDVPSGDGVVVENQPDDENKNKRPDLLKYLEEAWEKREVKFEPLFPKDYFEYPYGYNLGTKDHEKEQPTGRATLHDKNRLVLESNDIKQFVATMEGIKNAGHKSITLDLKGTEEEKKAFAAKAIVAGMVAGIEIKNNPYNLEDLKQFDERIEKVMRVEKVKKSINEATIDVPNEEIKKAVEDVYNTYTQIAQDLIPPKDQLKVFESGVEAAKHSRHKALAKEVLQKHQTTTRS